MTQGKIRMLRGALLASVLALLLNGCTPLEGLQALRQMVQDLVPTQLRSNYASVLFQLIDSARVKVVKGQPAQAVALLRTFKSYVTKYQNAGALDGNAASNLNSFADTVIQITNACGTPGVDTGIQLLWRFEEGSGTTTQDLSLNGNTGTLVNNPGWGSLFGNAVDFTAGGFQYVTAGVRPSLVMTNALTVAMRIRPNGNGILLNKEGEYELAIRGGEIHFALANTSPGWGSIDTDYAPTNGSEIHVALTYSSADGVARLYVDGTQVFQIAAGGAIVDLDATNNELRVGSRSFPEDFTGTIDEVRVYNRALSPAEVSILADPFFGMGP